MKQFNEWLQDELRTRGLKPADLSKASGLVPSTISRILSGQTRPSDEAYRKIASALGEPPEKILRLAGRLPQTDKPNTVEQDLLYSFRQLPESWQQFLLSMIRGVQDFPPPPRMEPNTSITLPNLPSPDIEPIIEIISRLDVLERRLVHDYACWRLTEQEQWRNSSDRRQKSKEAREKELKLAMEHIELLIAVDEADPLMWQRVIDRLQRIFHEKQKAATRKAQVDST